MKKKKVLRRSTYKIVCEITDDGKSTMSRTNDGFNAYELIGILELTQREIREQIAGGYTPDEINRKVIKRN